MVSELMAAINATKSAIDLLGNALKGRVDRAVDLAMSDATDQLMRLRGLAMSFQSEALGLKHAIDEATVRENALKAEIVQLKEFDADQSAYALTQVSAGAFVYCKTLPAGRGGEAEHGMPWFCPQCFDHRRKSILQYAGYDAAERVFKCPHCSCAVRVKDDQTGVRIVSRGRRGNLTDGY